eukprot:NODE_119_length_18186_cov_1.929397.p7 type:complete len:314 gc:universal NODE_119_length_18186_cov_1.929397:12648-11707(-)
MSQMILIFLIHALNVVPLAKTLLSGALSVGTLNLQNLANTGAISSRLGEVKDLNSHVIAVQEFVTGPQSKSVADSLTKYLNFRTDGDWVYFFEGSNGKQSPPVVNGVLVNRKKIPSFKLKSTFITRKQPSLFDPRLPFLMPLSRTNPTVRSVVALPIELNGHQYLIASFHFKRDPKNILNIQNFKDTLEQAEKLNRHVILAGDTNIHPVLFKELMAKMKISKGHIREAQSPETYFRGNEKANVIDRILTLGATSDGLKYFLDTSEAQIHLSGSDHPFLTTFIGSPTASTTTANRPNYSTGNKAGVPRVTLAPG